MVLLVWNVDFTKFLWKIVKRVKSQVFSHCFYCKIHKCNFVALFVRNPKWEIDVFLSNLKIIYHLKGLYALLDIWNSVEECEIRIIFLLTLYSYSYPFGLRLLMALFWRFKSKFCLLLTIFDVDWKWSEIIKKGITFSIHRFHSSNVWKLRKNGQFTMKTTVWMCYSHV